MIIAGKKKICIDHIIKRFLKSDNYGRKHEQKKYMTEYV